MSVADAQERISSREFSEWMAFYQLEPFGDERADLRAGIVASTMANAFRGKGRSYKPADFMPEFGVRDTRRMSTQELMARWKAATANVPRKDK